MSSDCSFEKHILSVSSRCSSLAGWILRTFAPRDKIRMLTLFKSLVLSRLDCGSQLWSPYKVKDISLLESVYRPFTKHIKGMHTYSYANRLSILKLYSHIEIFLKKFLYSFIETNFLTNENQCYRRSLSLRRRTITH